MTEQRYVRIGDTGATALRYQQLAEQFGTPLLVYDAQVVRQQYARLQRALPRVHLYYAVKAHPHERVIRTIDELGGGFDVASSGETDLLLRMKVFGKRTIHTHPIKKDAEIRTALRFGVTTYVVDNLHELEKLVPYRARVGVLLRVGFRSRSAVVDLSKKFGCSLQEVENIADRARQLGVHIKGLSFHVGSQCATSDEHVRGIQQCHQLMQRLNQRDQAPMNVLDVGGGFPADYGASPVDVDAFCRPIRNALEGVPKDWDILAEPGRFLVAAAVTSITSVVGASVRDGVRWYYLDDGVYGSYSGQVFDHACYPIEVLRSGPTHPSVLAGPTCDSIDIVADDIKLPLLQAGDLVIGHQMGAYTAATRTRFNSLPDARFLDLQTMEIIP